MNGMAASDKMFNILDLAEPEDGKLELKDGQADISFENVYFSYEENRQIIKGIDFSVKAGNFISFVGKSGCGKSTIASIMTGRCRGYSGKINIGGISLNHISGKSLMEHIVLVRHNSYLFKGTVEQNLRMAKNDASYEEMETVLKRVNLYDFLKTQDGLQTKLSERASNLSGGQCQRLAIARALLRNADIYIFDEATSNIDIESEELIMNVIHEIAKEKTVILISHRLANVVDSDRIYYLRDGMIIESGKHEELMSIDAGYRQLYDSQMELENICGRTAV